MLSMYPRLIAVHRSITVAGSSDAIGGVGYSGMQQSTSNGMGETALFTGIPASIQATAAGRKKMDTLPSAAVFSPTWVIYIPLKALAKGSVRDGDTIVDDEFYRYEVGQAYWNILGHRLNTIRLES
jgi:hypothetical protein